MANQRRVSLEQEKEVIRLFQEGHAISVIARTLDVPMRTMLNTARRLGLPVHRHGRRSGITDDQVQGMVEAYKQGVGTKELAVLHGVTDTTIARYLRAVGIAIRPAGFQRGESHHAWKGGRVSTEDGYILALVYPDDPFYPMGQIKTDSSGRYVLEHRLVLARHLGRVLSEDETVHHKDTDRTNNTLDNLQLRQGRHGKGGALRCSDCGSCNIVAVDLN